MSAGAAFTAEALVDARSRIGMWVFLGSEIMFFGPVFFGYLYGRYEWPDAFVAAAASTNIWCGSINTAVLLSSSAGVAMALMWAQAGARQQARRALDMVLLLAVLFLVIKGYEYGQDWAEHRVPGADFRFPESRQPMAAQLFFFVYFFSTLLHALHLTIGMGLLLFARARLASDPSHAPVRRLEITGLYWHFVDIIWIFLYPALYLAGRA